MASDAFPSEAQIEQAARAIREAQFPVEAKVWDQLSPMPRQRYERMARAALGCVAPLLAAAQQEASRARTLAGLHGESLCESESQRYRNDDLLRGMARRASEFRRESTSWGRSALARLAYSERLLAELAAAQQVVRDFPRVMTERDNAVAELAALRTELAESRRAHGWTRIALAEAHAGSLREDLAEVVDARSRLIEAARQGRRDASGAFVASNAQATTPWQKPSPELREKLREKKREWPAPAAPGVAPTGRRDFDTQPETGEKYVEFAPAPPETTSAVGLPQALAGTPSPQGVCDGCGSDRWRWTGCVALSDVWRHTWVCVECDDVQDVTESPRPAPSEVQATPSLGEEEP